MIETFAMDACAANSRNRERERERERELFLNATYSPFSLRDQVRTYVRTSVSYRATDRYYMSITVAPKIAQDLGKYFACNASGIYASGALS